MNENRELRGIGMKIAIVTVYDGPNFGSFLQAYALQEFLKEKGHEVFFVQRMSAEETLSLFTTNKPSTECGLLRKIWRKLKEMKNRNKEKNSHKYFHKQFAYFTNAWKEFKIISPDDLKDIDCVVCGSDEIWNLHNLFLDVSFYSCCDFGKDIPKVGLAVSSGYTTYEDIHQVQCIEESIRGFDEILVRDKRTKDVIDQICNVDSEIICDPTLLVNKNIFLKDKKFDNKGKYILIYAYGLTNEQEKIILHYARERGLKIVSACNYLRIADEVINESPFSFASLMKGAECCFTTTFHGSIFAMLFAKRFCSFAKYPKVEEIVSQCQAGNHLWDGKDEKRFIEIMEQEVDHNLIDGAIAKLRSRSIDKIDDMLEKIMRRNLSGK